MSGLRVLGIVPARGGSKRVPRKNVRELAGKPLVLWAVEAALDAASLDHIVVSSDDDEVLGLIADREVVGLRRPDELAGDESPAIDFVQHALAETEQSGATYDAVAIVQPSSPFTMGSDIDECVALLASSGADSAVTVMRVEHALHPSKFKRLDGDRLVPLLVDEGDRTSAHELDAVYVRNGSVYVTARPAIDRGELLGHDSRGVVMPRERSLDINDEQDLAFAAWLISQR